MILSNVPGQSFKLARSLNVELTRLDISGDTSSHQELAVTIKQGRRTLCSGGLTGCEDHGHKPDGRSPEPRGLICNFGPI